MGSVEHVLAGLAPTRTQVRDGSVQRLPLASIQPPPLASEAVRYAIARIDSSGTLPAAQVLDAMGWQPGDRLNVTVQGVVAVFQRTPGGLVAVTRRRALILPAAVRRVCGMRDADSLLIAATAAVDTVLVHPPVALDRMLTLYHLDDDSA